MRRCLLLVVLLLGIVGCQAGRPATPASQATAPTTHPPMVGQPGYTGYPTETTSPPTTRARGVRGDGVCDELERGSNSPDCDTGDARRSEVPADWVPCGQTGAYCPPGYDTPTLATYDPAPGRRWSYLDELAYERRLRAVLEELAHRPTWPTTRYGTYDHSWPNDPGPGSATRPIQPYQAFGNDPNDADVDGVSCEYGCKN